MEVPTRGRPHTSNTHFFVVATVNPYCFLSQSNENPRVWHKRDHSAPVLGAFHLRPLTLLAPVEH